MREEFSIETSEQFPLRPYKTSQLCKMYGVTKKTLLNWLKPFAHEIGEKPSHYYNVAQVEIIVKRLGVPGRMLKDDD